MAIVINGSGTVTGLAVGGLPDGTVDAGTLATDSVTNSKITDGAVDAAALATDSVVTAKIADGTIANADIASNAAIVPTKLTGIIGVGQTWQDLTSTRAVATTYTNSEVGPISCSVHVNEDTSYWVRVSVDGHLILKDFASNQGDVLGFAATFMVPAGSEYVVTTSGTSLRKWYECR